MHYAETTNNVNRANPPCHIFAYLYRQCSLSHPVTHGFIRVFVLQFVDGLILKSRWVSPTSLNPTYHFLSFVYLYRQCSLSHPVTHGLIRVFVLPFVDGFSLKIRWVSPTPPHINHAGGLNPTYKIYCAKNLMIRIYLWKSVANDELSAVINAVSAAPPGCCPPPRC